MKTVGQFEFPENADEASSWHVTQMRIMLHHQVMVIARTRIEGAWSAYVFPCPGENHDAEESIWKREGTKVSATLASQMFPEFEGVPYAS